MTVGERTARLWRNITALLRLRLREARQEANDAMRSALTGVVMILAALVIVLLAVPLMLTAGILLLALIVPAWLAATIVLAVALLAAAVLLWAARLRLRRRRIAVLDNLKADWQTIRRRLEEGS